MIETKALWEDRTNSDTIYRFETLILADRNGGHRGFTAAFKPWGDVFRLEVHDHWLGPLRQRLLDGYKGTIPTGTTASGGPKSKLPVITYITRQQTTRKLTSKAHDDLVRELEQIKKENLAEVNIEMFEERSVQDQIAIMGRTSVSCLSLEPALLPMRLDSAHQLICLCVDLAQRTRERVDERSVDEPGPSQRGVRVPARQLPIRTYNPSSLFIV